VKASGLPQDLRAARLNLIPEFMFFVEMPPSIFFWAAENWLGVRWSYLHAILNFASLWRKSATFPY
jgi:hypothetical protein